MYCDQISNTVGAPREWSVWCNIIGQGLAAHGKSLADSPLAARLMTRVPQAESIDQATCSILWNEALLLSDDPLLGLNTGSCDTLLPLPLQVLGLTAAASLNMSAAINSLVRFFSLVSTQATLELRVADRQARLLLHPRGRPHPQQMAALTGVVGSMLGRFAARCAVSEPSLALNLPGAQPDLPLPAGAAG